MKVLFGLLIFSMTLVSCGHESDPTKNYSKARKFVPEHDKSVRVQFVLNPKAVKMGVESVFVFPADTTSNFEIEAAIEMDGVSSISLKAKDLPTWAKLTKSKEEPNIWILTGSPESKSTIENINDLVSSSIELVPGQDTSPEALSQLKYYDLKKEFLLKIDLSNKSSEQTGATP